MPRPFNTTLFKDIDGWTVCENMDGQVIAEANSNIETVIQAALDRGGAQYWADGNYDVSSASDLKLKGNTTIYSSYNTKIRFPNGFTGSGLSADITYNGGTIENVLFVGGLQLQELGSTTKGWKGLHCKLNMDNGGVTDCAFNNVRVTGGQNSICIEIIHNNSWMTSSEFNGNSASLCKNGIEYLNTVGDTDIGISTLFFRDFWYQSHAQTEYGVKGIVGNNHVYENCAIWDLNLSTVPGGAHSAQFLPAATNMLVIGGIMMHYQLDNQAAKGQVRWIDGHGPAPVLEHYGELYQTPGDGVNRVITIPHGMGITPKDVFVQPTSTDASGPHKVTRDSTNIYVTYARPPPIATAANPNNIQLWWRAAVKST